MKRSIFIFLLIFFWASSDATGGETYVSPMPSLGLSLDPLKITEGFSQFIVSHVCDRLVEYNSKLDVVPSLANGWQISEDGKRYIFKLKNELYFHNGHQLSSDDVVWSISRMLRSDSPKYYELNYIKGAGEYRRGKAKIVSGIYAIDSNTVAIELVRPYPPLLAVLASPGAEIFSRVENQKLERQFFDRPVCVGPYQIVDRNEDVVRLEKDTKYYNVQHSVNTIEFHHMDREAAIQCFTSGECHDLRWYLVKPDELSGDYKVETYSVAHVNIIAFNVERSPFSNLKVRKAVAMAIDRKKLLQLCYPDKKIASGYIPPGLGGYDLDASLVAFDPIGAKLLLAQTGIPENVLKKRYNLLRMSNYTCKSGYKEYIEKSLSEIGMNIGVEYVSPDVFFQKHYNIRNYDMLNVTMTADYPEALFILGYFRSNYPLNYTGLSDKEIDSLLEKATTLSNRYDRYELYRTVQKILADELPVLPMYYDIWTVFYQRNVAGYKNSPLAIYNSSIRDIKFAH